MYPPDSPTLSQRPISQTYSSQRQDHPLHIMMSLPPDQLKLLLEAVLRRFEPSGRRGVAEILYRMMTSQERDSLVNSPSSQNPWGSLQDEEILKLLTEGYTPWNSYPSDSLFRFGATQFPPPISYPTLNFSHSDSISLPNNNSNHHHHHHNRMDPSSSTSLGYRFGVDFNHPSAGSHESHGISGVRSLVDQIESGVIDSILEEIERVQRRTGSALRALRDAEARLDSRHRIGTGNGWGGPTSHGEVNPNPINLSDFVWHRIGSLDDMDRIEDVLREN